jgi:hypothetical protein
MSPGRSRKSRLIFWLPFAVIYVAGTLGLGWLIGHPFGLTRWALGTGVILAGRAAATWVSRHVDRRLPSAAHAGRPD